MTINKIVKTLLAELDRAESLHPDWPDDPVHQVSILVEEAGETLKAVLDHKYHGKPQEHIRTEAIQTGAMVLRFLLNLDKEMEK